MDRQPHRIIVEGMDGSGKTTLIHLLETEFPHLEIVTRPQMVTFDDWWPEEMERTRQQPIPLHDRFFYSELVYGPILRKEIAASPVLVDNMAWFLRSVAFLIYCRPNSDVIRSNVMTGQHMDGVKDNTTALISSYDHIMAVERSWFGDRFFHYDYNTEGAFENLITELTGYLRR